MSTSRPEPGWRRWIAAAAIALVAPLASRGDEIIVRPNLRFEDRDVSGFDEDGVKLGPGRPIGWDEIVSGRVARDQARFDRLREALAEPLHRIRRALVDGDHAAALAPAEAMFPTYAGRRSGTAYMVSQALMWARLAHHRPEEAVEPYLVCQSLRETVPDLVLPGRRRPQYDARTGLSPELPLVGYDRDRAARACPGARARLRAIGNAASPGMRLHVAALAMAAGDPDGALAVLAPIGTTPRAVAEIIAALRAEAEVRRGRAIEGIAGLDRLRSECLGPNRALVGLLLGRARLALGQGDYRDGVLDLLDIAASHGDDQPAMAAAALYAAQEALRDHRDEAAARAVQVELLRYFRETDPGARLLAELGPGSDVARSATVAPRDNPGEPRAQQPPQSGRTPAARRRPGTAKSRERRP